MNEVRFLAGFFLIMGLARCMCSKEGEASLVSCFGVAGVGGDFVGLEETEPDDLSRVT